MNEDPVAIYNLVLHLWTESAVLVSRDWEPDRQVWIPKSQIIDTDLPIEDDEGLESKGYMLLPLWLAKKNRLLDT